MPPFRLQFLSVLLSSTLLGAACAFSSDVPVGPRDANEQGRLRTGGVVVDDDGFAERDVDDLPNMSSDLTWSSDGRDHEQEDVSTAGEYISSTEEQGDRISTELGRDQDFFENGLDTLRSEQEGAIVKDRKKVCVRRRKMEELGRVSYVYSTPSSQFLLFVYGKVGNGFLSSDFFSM